MDAIEKKIIANGDIINPTLHLEQRIAAAKSNNENQKG